MCRHVKFIRLVLGDAAAPMPAINVGSAFADAADAALKTTLKPSFSPYTFNGNDIFFLLGVPLPPAYTESMCQINRQQFYGCSNLDAMPLAVAPREE